MDKHPAQLSDVVRDVARADQRDGQPTAAWTSGRRSFLKGSVMAASAVAMPFEQLGLGRAVAAVLPYSPDYGPLRPVLDETTRQPLLNLPEGFRYKSYGWTNDPMSDGVRTPGSHDGMAVCGQDQNRIVLVRNHERGGVTGSFASPKVTYDPVAAGGTTNLSFNPRTGEWVGSWASLGGTLTNCAGGPTPWGTWLTCEETTAGPMTNDRLSRQHGWVFEVPAFGQANPVPLTGLGAFNHEATATDPVTGVVYLTEDATPSGFFRFLPRVKTRLAEGGQLQMMRVKGRPNAVLYGRPATGLIPNGTTFDVEWVPIDDPARVYTTNPNGTLAGNGVYKQGEAQGGAAIARGEGCWYGNGVIWFISTSGGVASQGQVWKYDPRAETVTMVYESPNASVLNNPDNCAWSPRGSLILCEDGGRTPQRLHGLTADGTLFPFCENNVVLSGFKGFTGDYRGNEFAGATFHHEWLFVNIQTPGITFAITGPWDNGAL